MRGRKLTKRRGRSMKKRGRVRKRERREEHEEMSD